MQKQTIDGHEVEFELADENFPKDRVMPFYVKSIDGSEYDKYLVVIGKAKGDTPENPIDGYICAICLKKQDAMMVTAAIRIAEKVADIHDEVATGDMKEAAKTVRERAKRSGWDVDKAEAKMDELIKQGKSFSEIVEYMNEHKADFKKPDAPKADAPKKTGEW
jgi:hypothetical protein